MELDDTIVAVASPPGGALRGIVRATGPNVLTCLSPLGLDVDRTRPQRYHVDWNLPPPLGRTPCDLYVWPGQRSYTRQPSVEVHTVGASCVLDAIVAQFGAAGARLAQPGEFTLRAFLAGRLDLTQAEAVLGVIDAHSQRELQVALKQLGGGLAEPLHQLRETLLNLLAHLEAGLDFVEEDIEFLDHGALSQTLERAVDQLATLQERLARRSRSVQRARVVLAGPPNAGKSCLFNALTEQSGAIVSAQQGTTRDYVSATVEWDGLEVEIVDTAGWEDGGEAATIRAAAQRQTAQMSAEATVEVVCVDRAAPLAPGFDREMARRDALVVDTKADLPAARPGLGLAVSGVTGSGLPGLRQAILDRLQGGQAEALANTAARCQTAVRDAQSALEQARTCATSHLGEELVAAEIRVALEHLGQVVGTIYTDDILDRIFSQFCIGK